MNSNYSTIKNFVKKYPDFLTEGGIRHLIFNSDLNGFDACIRRIGRRILLDEDLVCEWVRTRGHKNTKVSSPTQGDVK